MPSAAVYRLPWFAAWGRLFQRSMSPGRGRVLPKRHVVAFCAPRWPRGFSLLELCAVVTLLGVLAAVVVMRLSQSSSTASKNACYVCQGDIELQTQLWYRHKGVWPASNLSDIGADAAYFPSGLPVCPVDGSAYTLDGATHRVNGHTH